VSIKSPSKSSPVNGTPSRATPAGSLRLEKDVSRFTELLNETSPAAALKFLKEQWRAVLFNSRNEEQLEYILKAGLKNVPNSMVERLLKEKTTFANAFLKKASASAAANSAIVEEVLTHVTPSQIVNFVPKSVLDSVFAQRLKETIPPTVQRQNPVDMANVILEELKIMKAEDIVKLLAAANRLGFTKDDKIDPEDESVTPNVPVQMPPPMQRGAVSYPPPGSYGPPVSYGPPGSSPKLTQVHGSRDIAPSDTDPLLAEQERNRLAQFHTSRIADKAPNFFNSNGASSRVCPYCQHSFGNNLSGYNHVSYLLWQSGYKILLSHAAWKNKVYNPIIILCF